MSVSERARSPYEAPTAMRFVLSWRGLRVGKDRANQSIFHCMGDNVYIEGTKGISCSREQNPRNNDGTTLEDMGCSVEQLSCYFLVPSLFVPWLS